MLDFTAARIGKGLSVAPKPVDLHSLGVDAIDELRVAYPDRRIHHVQEGPQEAFADPERVSQLLGNLVSNAVAYVDPDREIAVTSRVDADGGAVIDVCNFGKPIPADAIPELFKPMVRGHVSGAARSVGLGPYIIGEIVEAHDGRVTVRSSTETGTASTATFPSSRNSMR